MVFVVEICTGLLENVDSTVKLNNRPLSVFASMIDAPCPIMKRNKHHTHFVYTQYIYMNNALKNKTSTNRLSVPRWSNIPPTVRTAE